LNSSHVTGQEQECLLGLALGDWNSEFYGFNGDGSILLSYRSSLIASGFEKKLILSPPC